MKSETFNHAAPATDGAHPTASHDLDAPTADPSQVSPSRKRPGLGYWWLVIAAISAGILFFSLSNQGGGEPAPLPLTATAKLADIENVVAAVGELQPSRYVDVGAQVSGQLEKLHVRVGDQVAAGDLVAEIDATVQLSRVAASRANLEALEAQLPARESSVKLAQARLARQTDMLARKATSEDDYDDAVDQLATARSSLVQLRSQIAQARAGLGSDEATLGYSRIFAPMSGTVVSIDKQEGQTLNASQTAPTLLRIADLSTMTVQAQVSEADVGKLHPGMDVYFTTLGGGERRWSGKLRQILPMPVIENNVVLYTALFDTGNADGALLMNMTAQVFFVTRAAYGVLSVPLGALSYPANDEPAAEVGDHPAEAGAAAIVRVVDKKGTTVERSVRVGLTNRVTAQILSGLSAGEKVVAGRLDSPGRKP